MYYYEDPETGIGQTTQAPIIELSTAARTQFPYSITGSLAPIFRSDPYLYNLYVQAQSANPLTDPYGQSSNLYYTGAFNDLLRNLYGDSGYLNQAGVQASGNVLDYESGDWSGMNGSYAQDWRYADQAQADAAARQLFDYWKGTVTPERINQFGQSAQQELQQSWDSQQDDDFFGIPMDIVVPAMMMYFGSVIGGGLTGSLGGEAAAGSTLLDGSGLATELAYGAPELSGTLGLGDSAAALVGGFGSDAGLSGMGDLSGAVADGGAMDMYGSIASPAGYSPVTEGTMGTIFDPAAVNTINALETPMGTGSMDMYGSLGTPAVAGVGGAGYVPVDTADYMAATGSSLSSALTGVPDSGIPKLLTNAATKLATNALLKELMGGGSGTKTGLGFGAAPQIAGIGGVRKARKIPAQNPWLGGNPNEPLGMEQARFADEALSDWSEQNNMRGKQLAAAIWRR